MYEYILENILMRFYCPHTHTHIHKYIGEFSAPHPTFCHSSHRFICCYMFYAWCVEHENMEFVSHYSHKRHMRGAGLINSERKVARSSKIHTQLAAGWALPVYSGRWYGARGFNFCAFCFILLCPSKMLIHIYFLLYTKY